MEPHDYLRALGRRKLVILAVVLVGAVAGWVTAPGSGARPTEYTATHTLATSLVYPENFNLDQAALLVTAGEVPAAVADRLGSDVDPRQLARQVSAAADSTLGTIRVRAEGTDPARTERIADLFAEELLGILTEATRDNYETSLAAREGRVAELQEEVDFILSLLPAGIPPEGTVVPPAEQQLRNDLAATTARFDAAVEDLDELQTAGPPPVPLATLDEAVALPASEEGFQAPRSKLARSALLGAFGLLIGLGVALAADRLDTRLRTPDDASRAFGLPVIAEIPHLSGRRRKSRVLLTVPDPSSPVVEAHRALRTVLLVGASAKREERAVATNGRSPRPDAVAGEAHQVILVTSPCPNEGKTTTVAHLASVLAETGKIVLAVSADFRRPCLHEYFGVEREPGLSDILSRRPGGPALTGLIRKTAVPGLSLLTAGAPTANPAQALSEAATLLRAARECFDFVVVDTAPLLVANDAAELAQAADVVLVQARSGRTPLSAAANAAEILARVNAPAMGVVLGDVDEPTAKYQARYYRHHGQGPDVERSASERSAARDVHAEGTATSERADVVRQLQTAADRSPDEGA